MSVLVDLLRHGEPEGGERLRGSCDDPLSPNGWAQMRRAVGTSPPWRRIVSSPLRRCSDFARELAARHGLPLVLDDRLREMYFGDWDGRSTAELLRTEPDRVSRFWHDPAANPPPGAEPFGPFRDRVLDAWTSLTSQNSQGHHLVILHGGSMRTILGHVLGLHPHALVRLEVPHAALSRIRLSAGAAGQVATSLVFHAGRL